MKKFFLSLVVMMIATVSFAQNTLVATLTHGDDIKVFYGVDALENANKAAEDGDIINLSGGSFKGLYSPGIQKAITIRGTGVNDANPTIVVGDIYITMPDSSGSKLIFEGCTMNGRIEVVKVQPDVYFYKCKIQEVNNLASDCVFRNGMFVNCDINDFSFWAADHSTSVQCFNCYVKKVDTPSSGSYNFVNCVIRQDQMPNSILVNCILYGSSAYGLGDRCNPINCVAVGDDNRSTFSRVTNSENCSYADLDIFIDSDTMNDLTDEAKAIYKGTDGTPIGVFGGLMPYDMTPSYPVITKMNVANKTTEDGKLSVDIEVKSVE